jgi:hypothetical protein
MLTRNLSALSLAALLAAAAPAALAQHDRDYRDDHRDYRHDMRRDHRDFARERRHEYVRHHEYREYDHAPRGYAVATPVFVPPSAVNIVFPIAFP